MSILKQSKPATVQTSHQRAAKSKVKWYYNFSRESTDLPWFYFEFLSSLHWYSYQWQQIRFFSWSWQAIWIHSWTRPSYQGKFFTVHYETKTNPCKFRAGTRVLLKWVEVNVPSLPAVQTMPMVAEDSLVLFHQILPLSSMSNFLAGNNFQDL